MNDFGIGINDKKCLNSAIMRMQNIYIILVPGFEVLDMAGPASVFSAANRFAGEHYSIVHISSLGGLVESASGVQVATKSIGLITLKKQDTLLVAGFGQEELENALSDELLAGWLRDNINRVRRYGSVCAGAFILAKAGLLKNKRITTHWAGIEKIKSLEPDAEVQGDALYINDGKLWTSAGITTGIDMTMEMVEQDLGPQIKGQVAKYLVVYSHRPGKQSQFSTLLTSQLKSKSPFQELLYWMEDNLGETLKVSDMAKKVGMTERTFYRHFTECYDRPPASYLERLRIERAKTLLEEGMNIKSITIEVGFRSKSGFRTSFEKSLGITPTMYRKLHHRD